MHCMEGPGCGRRLRWWANRKRDSSSPTSFLVSDNVLQLPMNLVLLKNIAVTGIHWGAYGSMYCFFTNSLSMHLTPAPENEPQRIPVVWKELLGYVLHFSRGRGGITRCLQPPSIRKGQAHRIFRNLHPRESRERPSRSRRQEDIRQGHCPSPRRRQCSRKIIKHHHSILSSFTFGSHSFDLRLFAYNSPFVT